jgi:hypothetical protein
VGSRKAFRTDNTPPKIQKLQRTLYRKAKAEPKYRFYSLYGELLRPDLLETAMACVAHNDGAAGVGGQQWSIDLKSDEAWDQWRDAMLAELRNTGRVRSDGCTFPKAMASSGRWGYRR